MRKGANKQTPSFIKPNGTGNQALKGTASTADGVGCVSLRDEQEVRGRYNNPNDKDYFQIGNGESDLERSNGFVLKQNGISRIQGGQVWMYDETTGTRLPVVAVIDDFRENVYAGDKRTIDG